MTCLIPSPSQSCCHSHCVNRSRAGVKCEKQEINYAPCGTTPPRKQPGQGPTNSCTLPCCGRSSCQAGLCIPAWERRVRDKGPVHLHTGAGARGLLDTPAAALTQHSNSVETKLVSNSSLGRRLKGSPLNYQKRQLNNLSLIKHQGSNPRCISLW